MKKRLYISCTIIFLGLFLIFFSYFAQKKIKEREIANGESEEVITKEILFEASKETLQYAKYLKIDGSANGESDDGYKRIRKKLYISYERTYQDPDNYMSRLNANFDLDVRTSTVKSDSCQYEYYYGYKEGVRQSELFDSGQHYFTNVCPDLLIFLFPNISKYSVDLSDVRNDVSGYENKNVYLATIQEGMSDFENEYDFLVGHKERFTKAIYIIDADTHVLKEFVAYGIYDQIILDLVIKEYDFDDHAMISVEDFDGFEVENAPNKSMVGNPKLVDYSYSNINGVLNEDQPLVLCNKSLSVYDTGQEIAFDNHWHQNATLIWNAIYDNGNSRYTLLGLKEKANEIAPNYGYDSAEMAYCVIDYPSCTSIGFLIKLTFKGVENGTGTILIPQTFASNKAVCKNVLFSMGDDDEIIMGNNLRYRITKKNKNNTTCIAYGELGYNGSIDVDESVMDVYPLSVLTSEELLLYFQPECREKLKKMAMEYDKSKYVGIRYHKSTMYAFTPYVDNYDSLLELYVPDYSSYNSDDLFKDNRFIESDKYGLDIYDSSYINSHNKSIYIKDFGEKGLCTWFNI